MTPLSMLCPAGLTSVSPHSFQNLVHTGTGWRPLAVGKLGGARIQQVGWDKVGPVLLTLGHLDIKDV